MRIFDDIGFLNCHHSATTGPFEKVVDNWKKRLDLLLRIDDFDNKHASFACAGVINPAPIDGSGMVAWRTPSPSLNIGNDFAKIKSGIVTKVRGCNQAFNR